MTKYFITATGTDIGKTYVTCSLIEGLVAQNKPVLGLKPIISGWQDYDDEMDTNRILKAMGRTFFPDDIETISPWRLSAPLAPDMAAAKENVTIDFERLLSFVMKQKNFVNMF
jgi:dethiobiotin synthetase